MTAGSSENHGLTGVTATVTAVLGLGEKATDNKREGYHVGWVKKTVGTGGRAGRVHYETLVAQVFLVTQKILQPQRTHK